MPIENLEKLREELNLLRARRRTGNPISGMETFGPRPFTIHPGTEDRFVFRRYLGLYTIEFSQYRSGRIPRAIFQVKRIRSGPPQAGFLAGGFLFSRAMLNFFEICSDTTTAIIRRSGTGFQTRYTFSEDCPCTLEEEFFSRGVVNA